MCGVEVSVWYQQYMAAMVLLAAKTMVEVVMALLGQRRLVANLYNAKTGSGAHR
jgi:hypothetical protein